MGESRGSHQGAGNPTSHGQRPTNDGAVATSVRLLFLKKNLDFFHF